MTLFRSRKLHGDSEARGPGVRANSGRVPRWRKQDPPVEECAGELSGVA